MTDTTARAQALLKDHRDAIDRLDAILVYTLAERFKHGQFTLDSRFEDGQSAIEQFLIEHGFIERLGNSRLRCTPAGMLILDAVVADLAC